MTGSAGPWQTGGLPFPWSDLASSPGTTGPSTGASLFQQPGPPSTTGNNLSFGFCFAPMHSPIYIRVFTAIWGRLKPTKCCLLTRETTSPGWVIRLRGIAIDPANMGAVQDWPTPATVIAVNFRTFWACHHITTIRYLTLSQAPSTAWLKTI